MANAGYVYIFRDPLNDNLIKVGLSKDPFARRQQLFRTGNALPFNFYQIWAVSDMRLAEQVAHNRLADQRVNDRREFFEIAPRRDFWPHEYTCYDTTTVCLDVLIELIEDDFSMSGIGYYSLNIQQAYQHYLNNNKTLPPPF